MKERTEYLVAVWETDKTPKGYIEDLKAYCFANEIRFEFDGVLFYEAYSDDLHKTFELGMEIARLEDKYGFEDPNVCKRK